MLGKHGRPRKENQIRVLKGKPSSPIEYCSDVRRRTKAFSVTPLEWILFEKVAKEARENGRTESKQMIQIIKEYFERKKMIEDINKNKWDGVM